MEPPWVVFTDLDESLLDRRYSFDLARSALDVLRRRRIPLVLCTSKTVSETVHFQKLLGVDSPFVVEGGGAVYAPRGYFDRLPNSWEHRGPHAVQPLSVGREAILRGLGHLKEFTANSIRGFDDMTVEEVARDTGLPTEMAKLAMDREFDEPFKFVRREGEFAAHLSRVARERELRVTRGGRYFHLHGDTDKGRAVQVLLRLFAQKLGKFRSVAIGDSEMDLPMLASVDVPVAIPRAGGGIDPVLALGVPASLRAPSAGPKGWSAAVLNILGAD